MPLVVPRDRRPPWPALAAAALAALFAVDPVHRRRRRRHPRRRPGQRRHGLAPAARRLDRRALPPRAGADRPGLSARPARARRRPRRRCCSASSIDVFAGLTLAIPALTALVAFAALDGLRTAGARRAPRRWSRCPTWPPPTSPRRRSRSRSSRSSCSPSRSCWPRARDWRDAIPLGVLAAGRRLRLLVPRPRLARRGRGGLGRDRAGCRGESPERRPTAWRCGAGRRGSAVAASCSCCRSSTGSATSSTSAPCTPTAPTRAGSATCRGQLSPLEALGIWPTSEFRLSATRRAACPRSSSTPAACSPLVAFALALPRWLRRHGPAIPAALLAAAVLYLAARALGTVYTSAKALAIAAPLIALVTLGGLLARRAPGRCAALGAVVRARRRLLSFLILRQAPVAPDRPRRRARRDPAAGRRARSCSSSAATTSSSTSCAARSRSPHVRNFYDPYFVEPNFELAERGLEVRLRLGHRARRWPGSRTCSPPAPPTRAARRRATRSVEQTDTYVLWRKGGRRRSAASPARPTPSRAASAAARGAGRARSRASPTRPWSPARDWSRRRRSRAASRRPSTLELPPGVWDLSLQYDATRPLTLEARRPRARPCPATSTTAARRRSGRRARSRSPAASRSRSPPRSSDPPLAGRLLGAHSVAHLGALAATAPSRRDAGCDGYVDWYEALMDIGFGEALLIIGALLAIDGGALGADPRHGALGLGALDRRSGSCSPSSTWSRSTSATTGVRRADRAGADPDPDLRRPARRPRAARPPLGPAGAGAGVRDADHPRACSRSAAKLLFGELDWAEAFLLGAVLCADRPGGHLDRWSPSKRGARRRSATRSTSSPGSTTGSRCRSCSSSSSSRRPAATPGRRRPSCSARRRSAPWSGSRSGSLGGWLHRVVPGGVTAALRGHLRDRLRARRVRARRRHLRQRADRRLRRRDHARLLRARDHRALRRLLRERQRDLPGAHLLRLRRDHRRHRLRRLGRWRWSRSSPSRCCVARPVAVMLVARRDRAARGRRRRSSPGSGPRAWPRCCSRCSSSTRPSANGPLVFDVAVVRDPRLDRRPRAHRHGRRALDRAADGGRTVSERVRPRRVEVGDTRPEEIADAVAVVARAMSTSPMAVRRDRRRPRALLRHTRPLLHPPLPARRATSGRSSRGSTAASSPRPTTSSAAPAGCGRRQRSARCPALRGHRAAIGGPRRALARRLGAPRPRPPARPLRPVRRRARASGPGDRQPACCASTPAGSTRPASTPTWRPRSPRTSRSTAASASRSSTRPRCSGSRTGSCGARRGADAPATRDRALAVGELLDDLARGLRVDVGELQIEADRVVDVAEQGRLLDLGRRRAARPRAGPSGRHPGEPLADPLGRGDVAVHARAAWARSRAPGRRAAAGAGRRARGRG